MQEHPSKQDCKNDSMLIMSAASFAGVCFWAITWSVKPTAIESTPRVQNGRQDRQHICLAGRSKSMPVPRLSKPHTANCPRANGSASIFPWTVVNHDHVHRPKNGTDQYQKVSRSNLEATPVLRRYPPVIAIRTAAPVSGDGRSFQANHSNNGTITTYRLVMKPPFPAVVVANPRLLQARPNK